MGKTRIHNIFELDVGERFKISGYDQNQNFYFNDFGTLIVEKEDDVDNTEVCDSYIVALIINRPSAIIRRPHYCLEQRRIIQALLDLGCKWVAKDCNGNITAFTCDKSPEYDDDNEWWRSSGWQVKTHVMDCLRPLIPKYLTPYQLTDMLEEVRNKLAGKSNE